MTTTTTTINTTSTINDGDEDNNDNNNKLERKIAIATEGLIDSLAKRLRRLELKTSSSSSTAITATTAVSIIVGRQNTETICNYIIAMNAEVNPSAMHRKNQLEVLCYLSEFYNNQKLFSKMTHDDVLGYLDSLRKPEASDPEHKWIGTYNLRKAYLQKFFKWLYYPDIEPSKRPKPKVFESITKIKRREQSTIKPSDLWTSEDDVLFLKYCPSKRDKAYHAIAKDSSCRPSEILGLRIRDMRFKTSGTSQYAEIVVNGKTGNRSIPLFAAVPYVKDWLDDHPQRSNPNAFLIPSFDRKHKKFGNRMKEVSLNLIYRKYKFEFFPQLLQDPKVVPEDKQKIKDLLKKPFNPYIFRHSALTSKSKILREHTLRQHAGWTGKSQMHIKYLHYFGNESNESLLAEYGIVTASNKDNVLLPANLRPKMCPSCNESNIPDCKFCKKCRMVLTYDAYEQTLEEQRTKDKRLEELEQNLKATLQTQQKHQELLEALWLQQQQQQQKEQQQQSQQLLPKKKERHSSPPNTHSSSSLLLSKSINMYCIAETK
jgi:integrase/recombinase XerD